MFSIYRFIRWVIFLALSGGVLGVLALTSTYYYLLPRLPSIEHADSFQLQVPLRVLTVDGKLIQEFGEKKRVPLGLEDIPEIMIKAVIASEDDRFYEHPGVDWQGLTRAALHLLTTGEKGPGGSTITMQVARNFFLGREKTYLRKANEILLAIKIEKELSKDEILELYFNKIFLGQRAYGVGAAAKVYYGKKVSELTLHQVAMIAGLPQAPSRFNPIANKKAAIQRREYVLSRMLELGFISETEFEVANGAPVVATLHTIPVEVEAHHLAEMVRAEMIKRFGDAATTAGYKVYTTIRAKNQEVANRALRRALTEYDQRHGFRGAESTTYITGPESQADEVLRDIPKIGGLIPALIISVEAAEARVLTVDYGEIVLGLDSVKWARRYIDENKKGAEVEHISDVLQPGDIVRVIERETGWHLSQVPEVEGALVSMASADGALLALTGGFDFWKNKYNRAEQAKRQAGSSFKPFIYSAALDYGFTPAEIIDDAPIVREDDSLEAEWRPENYGGKSHGPTRMREALVKSINLVAIRLLRDIRIDYALDYVTRFGFAIDRLPSNLSLALGSAEVSPIEMAVGYSVFANGGFRVDPYYIDRIVDSSGKVVFEATPDRVCRGCEKGMAGELRVLEKKNGVLSEIAVESVGLSQENVLRPQYRIAQRDLAESPSAPNTRRQYRVAKRVLDERNAWLMGTMLRDVVRFGTGRKAMALGRHDLSGKTGTTNEQREAWFSGFNSDVVTTVYVGFDNPSSMGQWETGARAALPMWIYYMGEVLKGKPNSVLIQPDGLISVKINKQTGQRAAPNDPDSIDEFFRTEYAPVDTAVSESSEETMSAQEPVDETVEQLF